MKPATRNCHQFAESITMEAANRVRERMLLKGRGGGWSVCSFIAFEKLNPGGGGPPGGWISL